MEKPRILQTSTFRLIYPGTTKMARDVFDDYASRLLDSSVFHAIMIRWKLAEEFLENAHSDEELANRALEILIREDVPVLLKELTRLRPDLSSVT
jgi:hypothetical protein